MLIPPSELPKRVTQQYWAKVRQLLCSRHRLTLAAARRGIQAYRDVLARSGVRDEIYHAPVDDTARGIVQGGYTTKEVSPEVALAVKCPAR